MRLGALLSVVNGNALTGFNVMLRRGSVSVSVRAPVDLNTRSTETTRAIVHNLVRKDIAVYAKVARAAFALIPPAFTGTASLQGGRVAAIDSRTSMGSRVKRVRLATYADLLGWRL